LLAPLIEFQVNVTVVPLNADPAAGAVNAAIVAGHPEHAVYV
jgi:hypothetical protein